MHIFHKWSKWVVGGRMQEHTIPIGYEYSAEVRGKVFTTNWTVQHRTCEVCGKTQVEKLESR